MLERNILMRHFFEIDTDELQLYMKNKKVVKVFVSIVKITDTDNVSHTFLLWVTDNEISDLQKIYVRLSYFEMTKKIVEEIEYDKALKEGHYNDFVHTQFLFILNDADEYIVDDLVCGIEDATFKSNKFKFLRLHRSLQLNIADSYADLLVMRMFAKVDFDEVDIFMEWDLSIKQEMPLFNEYDIIIHKLSNRPNLLQCIQNHSYRL